jgi:hypothetical protein
MVAEAQTRKATMTTHERQTDTVERVTTLEELARETIGDGGSPNLYFVTDNGDVVTVTRDRALAYRHWRYLADQRPLRECALEDRKYGVICSVEPRDEGSKRLVVRDDYTE